MERIMIRHNLRTVTMGIAVVMGGELLVLAQGGTREQERKVGENEVPAAALAALKKLAGAATITEFAEEIEDGRKFYEGSWKGPEGKVDSLVTEAGDLVEIEEVVAGNKVPAVVRAEAEKEAGKDGKLMWEKKTVVMYEVHFTKDGQGREIILTPDGRRFHEEGGDEQDQDEGHEGDE